jgi:hypothetical protein
MHKRLILTLSLAVLVHTAFAQNSYVLTVPGGFPEMVSSDVLSLLGQGSRKKWNLETGGPTNNPGILLQLIDNPQFKTKESYRFESNGETRITISSSSQEGLVFGLYKYLRTLGYKFYLPGTLYTLIPSLQNPFGPKKNIVDKPFLQVRDFFGTGGFGSGMTDPDKSVQEAWLQWKVRNGFGSAYQLSGHRGENFILENKATLRQHPDWLASPLTGNDQSDQGIKLNYLNKDALNFFVDWTIESLTRKSYQRPPPGHSDFVSIEPSDGGGYLNDLSKNAGKKLPSISDQVYAAANLAAQKLDRAFPNHPNIGVNLYAYSGHAEPPSFKLHPRVFVQLIPYQFQTVAYGPSFIKLWKEKASRFGLYDYLNYADAQFDLPGGLTLDQAMKRLVHSVKSGSEGTTYETSYSKFATGIPLWVIGRYMTDGDADWKKNLDIISADLFKNGKQPAGKLFSLFYTSAFNVNDLGNALALVESAGQAENDANVKLRLNELRQYLYYAHLVYQSRNETRGSLKERFVPVAEYAWKIYESGIIHSYRIMQLVSYAFLNIDRATPDYASYQELHTAWFPETERNRSAWARIQQVKPSTIEEQGYQALKKNYPVSASSSAISWNEVLKSFSQNHKPKKKMVVGGDNLARGYFGIYSEKPTEVKMEFKLTGSGQTRITISGIDNNYSSPQVFTSEQKTGSLKLDIPAGETSFFINTSPGTSYRLEVKIDEGIIYFDGSPRGIIAFYKDFSAPPDSYTYDPEFYPSHVFIPSSARTVNYKVQLNALAITAPSGKRMNTDLIFSETGGFETRSFKVLPAEAGRLWKAAVSGNFNYSFLNIPDRYFLLEGKN